MLFSLSLQPSLFVSPLNYFHHHDDASDLLAEHFCRFCFVAFVKFLALEWEISKRFLITRKILDGNAQLLWMFVESIFFGNWEMINLSWDWVCLDWKFCKGIQIELVAESKKKKIFWLIATSFEELNWRKLSLLNIITRIMRVAAIKVWIFRVSTLGVETFKVLEVSLVQIRFKNWSKCTKLTHNSNQTKKNKKQFQKSKNLKI